MLNSFIRYKEFSSSVLLIGYLLIEMKFICILLTAFGFMEVNSFARPYVIDSMADFSQLIVKCNYQNIRLTNINKSSVPVGIFRECRKTIKLTMAYNGIKTLVSGTFLGLKQLEQLYLLKNDIEYVESSTFHILVNLRTFVMSGNKIITLPDYGFTSTYIAFFNINNNQIQTIPKKTMMHLKNVQIVDLSMNRIEYLDPEFMINLRGGGMVILNNNLLTSLNLNFKTTSTYTTDFQASGNKISVINKDTLGSLYNLKIKKLNLSFNKISIISPGVFQNYSSIQILLLSHNDIHYLFANTLKGLDKLNFLDLSNNNIDDFIYELALPPSIATINFSHNKIHNIEDFRWITRGTHIIDLNLNANNISFFDYDRMSSRIKRLSISNNLWSCKVLKHIINNLSRKGVYVVEGFDKDLDNINGIRCFEKEIERKSNKDNYLISRTKFTKFALINNITLKMANFANKFHLNLFALLLSVYLYYLV